MKQKLADPFLNELQMMNSVAFGCLNVYCHLAVIKNTLNVSDLCQSQPCQNNGECVDLIDHIECRCPRGYHGSFCEMKGNVDRELRLLLQ
jgi:hypothetical protein